MFRRTIYAWLVGLYALTMLVAAQPLQAAPFDQRRLSFAEPRFEQVWTRTDTESVRGGRTWYWGPNPWFDYYEFYRQGANGLRQVQYFDKARMELNHPNEHSGSQQGVTNGLLVKEMIAGHIQLGDDPYDYAIVPPSDVPVAGNPRSANDITPGYVSFFSVATLDSGYRDALKMGQRVNTFMDRSGRLSNRDDLALPETETVVYNAITGHNIPRIFWDFMNLKGSFYDGMGTSQGIVVDWLFAMGLPITDAYWVRAKVGGAEKDVLVQLFERRILTYIADNPAGYKVEMGNVGQHYFQWRYTDLGQPWAAPDPNPPLLYVSDTPRGHWEVFMHTPSGPVQLTETGAETIPYSYQRSYDIGSTRLLVDSRRSDGKTRQLYELTPAILYGGPYQKDAADRLLNKIEGLPDAFPFGNMSNPALSPDGKKLAFISDVSGMPTLYLVAYMRGSFSPGALTQERSCTYESPSWSPDGRVIYWVSNCSGSFQIYRGELSYQDDRASIVQATLVNVQQLTSGSTDNRYPRVSPDGNHVAFTSYRDGNGEIYLMNADGSAQARLTNNPRDDSAPTWSWDNTYLAFASNRDGIFQIYQIKPDGTDEHAVTNLRDNLNARWPLWAQ